MIELDTSFPMDFEDAWRLIGYSSKHGALKTLRYNFKLGVDYIELGEVKRDSRGRERVDIRLSLSCYKELKNNYRVRQDPEWDVTCKLQEELGGRVEVKVEDGSIDLLTDDELIEVKESRGWKSGIGQLLVYKYYYPKHRPRLHLFRCSLEVFKRAELHCKRLGINLTRELD